jgi:hypothetical protein
VCAAAGPDSDAQLWFLVIFPNYCLSWQVEIAMEIFGLLLSLSGIPVVIAIAIV